MASLSLCKLLFATLVLSSCAFGDKPVSGGYDTQPAQPQATQATAPQGPAYGYDYAGNGKELRPNTGGYSAGGSWSNAGSSHAESSYQPPTTQPGNGWNNNDVAYVYHYQHFPNSGGGGKHTHGGNAGVGGGIGGGIGGSYGGSYGSGILGGGGSGWSDHGNDLIDDGESGLGGLSIGAVAAVIKGIIAIKPFLILGLLLLIAIPVAALLFPLPLISVTTPSRNMDSARGPPTASAMLSSYVSQLSEKIMSNDECFESIVCRIPPAPAKYQGKAKLLWEQYGKKYFSSARVQRAMTAFFEESVGRSRSSKCNQKFKCPYNKYF